MRQTTEPFRFHARVIVKQFTAILARKLYKKIQTKNINRQNLLEFHMVQKLGANRTFFLLSAVVGLVVIVSFIG